MEPDRTRTGFIGTDYGNGTHGFAGMELAHQIVRLQHSSHKQKDTVSFNSNSSVFSGTEAILLPSSDAATY